jgi:histidinol dehydrogenase
MMQTTRLDADQADFDRQLDALLAWEAVSDQSVETTVRDIIAQVRSRGDEALLELTNRFDRRDLNQAAQLEIAPQQLQQALEAIDADTRAALQAAAARIRDYHERQRADSWDYTDDHGNRLGQLVRPLDRVGLYVPGGKAAYPSSVLMNSIPAKVAGVDELIMVVPAPDEQLNDLVLAAAAIGGVDRLFTIGGAQAIAALAYGTDTVPAVDKIVGPGNIFVATAKREVFGKVGIDMIAGPSEICVVCDGDTDPDWIALDLFSQAEHDEDAQAILVSLDAAFTDRVSEAMQRLVASQPRAKVIAESMRSRGCLIDVRTRQQAIDIVNRIAPEHLELSVGDAEQWLPLIRHAGAIFLGRYTPEALGDYCAGPNHVLPTAGTARFSSPLGVYDFQKRSSIIGCSRQGASALAGTASLLARGEGLVAHAQSAEARL